MNETAETFADMVDVLIRTQAQVPSMHMVVPLRSKWETASLLIHMGRDHGLASYPKWAKYCYNITLNTFDDLQKVNVKQENIDLLQNVYKLVRNKLD